MEIVEPFRCNVMRDYDFVFVLTRCVNVAITCSDEQTVWSEHCMSDVVSHFIMLITWLIARDFARHQVRGCSFAGVRIELCCFSCLSVAEQCIYVEGRAASSWTNDCAGNFVNELVDGGADYVTRWYVMALEVGYLV